MFRVCYISLYFLAFHADLKRQRWHYTCSAMKYDFIRIFFKSVWLRGSIKFDRVVQVFCLFVCAFFCILSSLAALYSISTILWWFISFVYYVSKFFNIINKKIFAEKNTQKIMAKKMYRLNGRWNQWSKINLILLKNDDKTTKAHYG